LTDIGFPSKTPLYDESSWLCDEINEVIPAVDGS
jgi:hypothetical protein